ncbi:MAG: 6,7-dimethyl-8-ribityllumazine synthase [Phycisphaerae bacterium]
MPNILAGRIDAAGKRLAIVVARWNEFVTKRLAEGAVESILRSGGRDEDITQVWVPGSFEIPLAAKALAESGRFDAVICLGCLLKGETIHFDLIAAEAAKGINQVALSTGVPVTLGVITVDTLEQAIERVGGKHGNKGSEAALAAIEMIGVLDAINAPKLAKRAGRV